MYIPHQHLDIVHRQMLREAMEQNALHRSGGYGLLPIALKMLREAMEQNALHSAKPEHLTEMNQAMLQEALEQNALHPRRSPKRKQEKRQRRLMRVPALLMVKLGRRLEGFGQAYLEDRQRCSA